MPEGDRTEPTLRQRWEKLSRLEGPPGFIIWQFPNPPLILALVAIVAGWLTTGTAHSDSTNRPWRGDARPAARARVTAVEFRGDREHLRVALRDGHGLTLTAVHPGGEGDTADFAVGAEVAIGIPAENLWFLPGG